MTVPLKNFHNRSLNIGLLGSDRNSVGKANIALCYAHGEAYLQDSIYDNQETYSINVPVASNCTIKVTFHDIRDCHQLRKNNYHNVHEHEKMSQMDAFFVVFSEYVQESFTILDECMEALYHSKKHWSSSSNNPVMVLNHLFTNDIDNVPSTQITSSELTQLANKWNVKVTKVASRSRVNMDESLNELIHQWMAHVYATEQQAKKSKSSSSSRKQLHLRHVSSLENMDANNNENSNSGGNSFVSNNNNNGSNNGSNGNKTPSRNSDSEEEGSNNSNRKLRGFVSKLFSKR